MTLAPTKAARSNLQRRALAAGAVLWASFLAASAGTMFFFAFVAPDDLLAGYAASDRIDRIGVYTLGFFGLWCLSALASALALYIHHQVGGDNAAGRPPGANQ